ncbi:hypothetical protein [Pararhodobacter oceanensis]|uniref:DUF4169 domain-containing protein n=1 Tax=Pararhodobacter oceanensis TaxID=2172121 RepID=A0A2T8HQR2_9RHOB|nr:hypothetical protein [Pararhodobacter oceanensis]PVH27781.1 hypothetical protein DDE20_15880 [Pararhodobacter oceanensis]
MTQEKPATNAGAETADLSARRVKAVKGTKGDHAREARIKAALKANIARRKAQAKARDTGRGEARDDKGNDDV